MKIKTIQCRQGHLLYFSQDNVLLYHNDQFPDCRWTNNRNQKNDSTKLETIIKYQIMRTLKTVLFLIPFLIISVNAEAKKITAEDIPYSGRVGEYKGRNVLFINDQPYAPIMYSGTEQGRNTWLDPTKKSIQEFCDQGYEIIQTDTWFKYLMGNSGTFYVPQLLKKQLASILEISPDAKIVLRINVSAPGWWIEENPTEVCQVTNPGSDNSFGGNSQESLASEAYREFAKTNLKIFLEELLKLPESDHIIGIHIGGGVYGEWHYYGIKNEPDKSVPMRRRFARFGIDKYGSLEAANQTWGTSFGTVEEVEVPTYARRYETSDVDFRNVSQDKYVIDYYQCQQKTVSSLVYDLAKITKETWPRPVITGVFYGYFYGGFTVGAEAGQNDIETIFQCPYLDYFAGPYYSRDMNGSGCYRSLAESAALNGKIFFTEHDGGTHLGSSGSGTGSFPDIPANERQSIARMRRNYMYSLTENGGQWWYDFGPKSQGGGWWSTPAMLQEAKDLLSLSTRLLEEEYDKPADVLLVADMESYYYMRPKMEDKLSSRLTESLADALLGTGTCFDKIFMMDFGKADLSKYKTVIFSNTIHMNDAQRDYIRNQVMTEGRTVVFMSGAGYINDEKNDVSLISDLTGISVKKLTGNSSIALTLNGKSYTLNPSGIQSMFYVDDPEVVAVGRYASGEVGACKKTVNCCTVYYFGLPLASYRDLLIEAGNRMFADQLTEQDYVTVGGGIITLYTVQGGNKTIKPLNGTAKLLRRLNPYSCYYFDLHTGEQLNF